MALEEAMTDKAYYANRELRERALAKAASEQSIGAIHISLADKYAKLARREGTRPELEMASQD